MLCFFFNNYQHFRNQAVQEEYFNLNKIVSNIKNYLPSHAGVISLVFNWICNFLTFLSLQTTSRTALNVNNDVLTKWILWMVKSMMTSWQATIIFCSMHITKVGFLSCVILLADYSLTLSTAHVLEWSVNNEFERMGKEVVKS